MWILLMTLCVTDTQCQPNIFMGSFPGRISGEFSCNKTKENIIKQQKDNKNKFFICSNLER